MSESSGFQKYSISWVFQALFSLKPLSISTKYNQPIYYEDAPVSCRLCLMMGGGVLIKICSKAVRSHLHFWWWWWWWWRWQWWRTLSHIDAQKPIYGKKYLWEFGCTPWWLMVNSSSNPLFLPLALYWLLMLLCCQQSKQFLTYKVIHSSHICSFGKCWLDYD